MVSDNNYLIFIHWKNKTFFIADSDQDTDPDMHEWENQQIRKGVTGAQVYFDRQVDFKISCLIFLSSSVHS